MKNFDKTVNPKLLGSFTVGLEETPAVTSTPITIENVQMMSSPEIQQSLFVQGKD